MKTSSAVISLRVVRDRTVRYSTPAVNDSAQALALARVLLEDRPHESLLVILVDGCNKVIGAHVAATGGLHGVSSCLRDIFRAAVAANASAIVLAHNHPSGDPTPSTEDAEYTRKAIQAGKLLGFPVLDHVVIGDGASWSMREKGDADGGRLFS